MRDRILSMREESHLAPEDMPSVNHVHSEGVQRRIQFRLAGPIQNPKILFASRTKTMSSHTNHHANRDLNKGANRVPPRQSRPGLRSRSHTPRAHQWSTAPPPLMPQDPIDPTTRRFGDDGLHRE